MRDSAIFGTLDVATGQIKNIFGPSDGAGNLIAGSFYETSSAIFGDTTGTTGIVGSYLYESSGSTTLNVFHMADADYGADGTFAEHGEITHVGYSKIKSYVLAWDDDILKRDQIAVIVSSYDGTDYFIGLVSFDLVGFGN
jgi:hypothetical protein